MTGNTAEPHASGRAVFSSWVAVACAAALLIGLGTWQLQRKAWKESVLTTMAERAKLPPVADLATLDCKPEAGLLDPCDFRPVAIAGRLQSDDERHIFISVPLQANGIGGPGYWVFALLRPSGSAGPRVAVNRGFVPQARKAIATRQQGQIAGEVQITGVLRRAEPRTWSSAHNDIAANVYFVRDPAELYQPCRCGPTCDCRGPYEDIRPNYYIDQTGPAPPGGLPFPMAGKMTISNRHLEYALTWYALAATLLGVALVRWRSGRTVSAPTT
jgi:surfeit locus 1 family protein